MRFSAMKAVLWRLQMGYKWCCRWCPLGSFWGGKWYQAQKEDLQRKQILERWSIRRRLKKCVAKGRLTSIAMLSSSIYLLCREIFFVPWYWSASWPRGHSSDGVLLGRFFNSEVEPVGGEKAACGNEALAKASTGWCFKQSGVLKVESISHHRKG